jgi:hypothetical protein
MLSPAVPRSVLAAAIPARFVYWSGHSGRRYLFTAVGREGIGHFDDGVAIAVAEGRIVWAGEIGALHGRGDTAALPRAAWYVHLLAATREERRDIVEDLRPVERSHLRLAA